ncbi:hypothetical protein [Paenibacillus sp. ACRRY]|uniref:hypothetical protein n=1 Tax=Paenibacillus sp. ACRRY TaxID=2918208 RepID=UPI001EF5B2D4|nr:hypothetical protein [Paenibacillus sp. ACRRY]MCG7383366.1 hypothetical protein [Paenibacillus sp. ACRRY]
MNEELTKYIDQMAAKLGVAASHVYEVVIRQTVISGIVNTVVQVLIMIAIYVAFRKGWRYSRDRWDDWYSDDNEFYAVLIWILGGVVCGGIFIACAVTTPDAIMSIFNPEYYAIKTILEAVK